MTPPDLAKIIIPIIVMIGSFSWTQFNSLTVIGTKLDNVIELVQEVKGDQKEFSARLRGVEEEARLNRYRIEKLEKENAR